MLGNTRTHSHTLKRKQTNSDTLEHTQTHSNCFGHSRQHSNTLQHSGQRSHVLGNIQTSSATREHTGTHTDIHDNTRMHSITSGTFARSPTHLDTHAGKYRRTRTHSTFLRHSSAEPHSHNTESRCLSAPTEIGVCISVYVRARVYVCSSVSECVLWSVLEFLSVPECARVRPSVLVCSQAVVSVVEFLHACARV